MATGCDLNYNGKMWVTLKLIKVFPAGTVQCNSRMCQVLILLSGLCMLYPHCTVMQEQTNHRQQTLQYFLAL